jgi:hypothetical protein
MAQRGLAPAWRRYSPYLLFGVKAKIGLFYRLSQMTRDGQGQCVWIALRYKDLLEGQGAQDQV